MIDNLLNPEEEQNEQKMNNKLAIRQSVYLILGILIVSKKKTSKTAKALR